MPKSKSFGNFTPLAAVPPRRLLVASGGPPKVGKNHFGLTAPGPIFGQYFDPGGLEGMAEKFLKAPLGPKEIYQAQYRFNKRKDDKDAAKEVKEQFIKDYEDALGWARTIQWDETEFYEVCRFAEFGRESAKGREYGPLNGEYRGLVQAAYDAGVNLHLIHKLKEKWEDDKPTGVMVASGFPQVAGIVQVNLRHTWSREDGFQIEIASCRQNMTLAGEKGDFSWAEIGMLIHEDSTEEDWQ